jgi:hypothetical protein
MAPDLLSMAGLCNAVEDLTREKVAYSVGESRAHDRLEIIDKQINECRRVKAAVEHYIATLRPPIPKQGGGGGWPEYTFYPDGRDGPMVPVSERASIVMMV